MCQRISVGHCLDHLRSKMFKDFLSHSLQVEFRIPSPILAGNLVLQIVRPAVSDALLKRIDVVFNLERRNVLFDFGSQLRWIKCNAVDIV